MPTAITPVNRFRLALAQGHTQIGLWLGLASGYSAEICAGAGFDWLLIDGEHAPNDLRSILHQLQAAAAYPTHCVVRPPVGDTHLIKQLLDIGAQTLLVPMVETAAQAEALVAAMHYPPRGVRGVGSPLARASGWARAPDSLERRHPDDRRGAGASLSRARLPLRRRRRRRLSAGAGDAGACRKFLQRFRPARAVTISSQPINGGSAARKSPVVFSCGVPAIFVVLIYDYQKD